jgi:hypothetical protein
MKTRLISGYQTSAFWIVSVITLTIIIAVDYYDGTDSALMIYGVNAVTTLICACLFAGWWRAKGSATTVYKWITVLLFATSWNDSVQFYGRWLFVYSKSQYLVLLESPWWEYRSVPKMIALIYLLSFAVWQRYGSTGTYQDCIRGDMSVGFTRLEDKLMGHYHDDLGPNSSVKVRMRRKGDTE